MPSIKYTRKIEIEVHAALGKYIPQNTAIIAQIQKTIIRLFFLKKYFLELIMA
jgi:hypothetical protein